MAQSTPLRLLATLDAVTFHFPIAPAVDVVVNFYDVAGAVVLGAGSIDLTASRPLSSSSGAVSAPGTLPDVEPTPISATQTCDNNTIYTFALGGRGATVLKLTPSAVTPPGGGVSYTIKVIAAQKRPPEPLT